MGYRVYKKGNYLVIKNEETGSIIEGSSSLFEIIKHTTNETGYRFLKNGKNQLGSNKIVELTDIKKEDGSSYTQQEFDDFKNNNTAGFNDGGGNGNGVDSITGYGVDNTDTKNPVILDFYEERNDTLSLQFNNVWHTITVPGSPQNKLLNICIIVDQDNQDVGVRQVGSTLNRFSNIGENGFGVSSVSSVVKSNNSGEIQVYSGDINNATFKVLAYQN